MSVSTTHHLQFPISWPSSSHHRGSLFSQSSFALFLRWGLPVSALQNAIEKQSPAWTNQQMILWMVIVEDGESEYEWRMVQFWLHNALWGIHMRLLHFGETKYFIAPHSKCKMYYKMRRSHFSVFVRFFRFGYWWHAWHCFCAVTTCHKDTKT